MNTEEQDKYTAVQIEHIEDEEQVEQEVKEEQEENKEETMDWGEGIEDDDTTRKLGEDETYIEDILSDDNEENEDDDEQDGKITSLPAFIASPEDFSKAIIGCEKGIDEKTINNLLKDKSSRISRLVNAITNMKNNDTLYQEAWKKCVENCKDIELIAKEYIKDDIKLKATAPVPNKSKGGAVVRGAEAQLLIAMHDRDIKRDFLYNSGISIVLRSPSSRELNIYYSNAHGTSEEFGKEMGPHFYMFHDYESRRAGMELIESMTEKCNIRNWKSNKSLRKCMSVHDYPVALWMLGTMMYKDGFEHEFTCLNPNEHCNYKENKKIDLSSLRLNNYNALSDEHFKLIGSNAIHTTKELDRYRETLFEEETIPLYGNWVVVPQVPTMYEYLEYGEMFKSEMLRHVMKDEENEVHKYLLYNFYHTFVPWIKEVRHMNEDGSIDFRVVEASAIEKLMDITKLEGTDFAKDIVDYIQRTQITFIGHRFDGCPSCGFIPPSIVNGFMPFDPQTHFFILSVMRLNQL